MINPRTFIPLIIALFFPFILNAQLNEIDKVVKDPSVIWASEIYLDISPDDEPLTKEKCYNVQTLKIVDKPMSNGHYAMVNNENHCLSTRLFDKFYMTDLNNAIFKGTQLEDEYSQTERERLAKRSENIDRINTYRLKTLLYYDKDEMMFKSHPLAIAPIQPNSKRVDGMPQKGALFWVPVSKSNETMLGNEIDYAKRIDAAYVMHDEMRKLHGKLSLDEVWDVFVDDIRSNISTANLTGVLTVLTGEFLTAEQIDMRLVDSQTQQRLKAADIEQMRLVHDISWDNVHNRLNVHYVGFGPVSKLSDNDDPLFWKSDAIDLPK